jgi:hypothetical protein
MAGAFAQGSKAGHNAYLAGPMSVQEVAVGSTPEIGHPFTLESYPSTYGQRRLLQDEGSKS